MFDFSRVNWDKVQDKTIETLIMTFESLIAVFIVGLFLGLLLYLTSNSKSAFGRGFYAVVTAIVNIFRAIPFIILIVLLIPFTKFLIGTIIGVQAAIPALIISAAPFYARLVEIGLREVDKGVIEAARAMGAKNSTIILKVLIPESLPAIISGLTVTAIALVGLIPNDPGWMHIAHDIVAQLIVLFMAISILGIRWFLPNADPNLYRMSYFIVGLILISYVLWHPIHYLTLTAFEILSFSLSFAWLLLLVNTLINMLWNTKKIYKVSLNSIEEKNEK